MQESTNNTSTFWDRLEAKTGFPVTRLDVKKLAAGLVLTIIAMVLIGVHASGGSLEAWAQARAPGSAVLPLLATLDSMLLVVATVLFFLGALSASIAMANAIRPRG